MPQAKQVRTIPISIVNDGYVEGNETFTFTLSNASGMTLGAPATTTITIVDNDSNPTNPFNDNAFFVRQQYLDFLFREPDTGGFNDWLSVLNNCGPNQGGLGSPIRRATEYTCRPDSSVRQNSATMVTGRTGTITRPWDDDRSLRSLCLTCGG